MIKAMVLDLKGYFLEQLKNIIQYILLFDDKYKAS